MHSPTHPPTHQSCNLLTCVQLLMEYQTLRGGRVKLQNIVAPEMEFDHADKGEALYITEASG